MGGPDGFQLAVEGPGIYFGGQTIKGYVQINASEAMPNVKNVQVMLKGYGSVHWKEKKLDKNQQRKGTWYHYRNHEEYVDEFYFVHHGPLAAGNHVLPFSFILPEKLPTSFEGEHGHIRYFVESNIERSGLFKSNKRNKQFITINSVVDLNVIEGVNMSQTKSETKTELFKRRNLK